MNLMLFFTRGVSLEIWLKSGLLEREKLIYEEHLNQGNLNKVYWLTYGCNDVSLSKKLKQDGKLHLMLTGLDLQRSQEIWLMLIQVRFLLNLERDCRLDL